MFTGFYVAVQKSDIPHYVIFPVSIYWPTSCSAPFIMFIKVVFNANRGERSKNSTVIPKNILSQETLQVFQS